ncbi:MAG: MCP four helix bundle domain-containing protein, partial [Clostridiales bacterium]|nr:MCP four helix bundle domain-containing protein [Clostridiales bacterium]
MTARFQHLPVGFKIGLLSIFLMIGVLLVGGTHFVVTSLVHGVARSIAVDRMGMAQDLTDLGQAVLEARNTVLLMLADVDPEQNVLREERLSQLDQKVQELVARYEKLAPTPEERKVIQTFKARWQAYQESRDGALALLEEGKLDEAREALLQGSGGLNFSSALGSVIWLLH